MKLNNFNNNLAFSLIELSIVLIIIGLLVAGITGGISLVKSAKYRAITIEIFSWEQVAFIFKLAKNRLPGDLNNDGLIDNESTFPSNLSFNYPYDTSSSVYQKPNHIIAPFVELFLEEIINFKPQKTGISTELEVLAKIKPCQIQNI